LGFSAQKRPTKVGTLNTVTARSVVSLTACC
jgi:hypothetical protein